MSLVINADGNILGLKAGQIPWWRDVNALCISWGIKMSLQQKALKGASWLALFKFVSQAISWSATIVIAWLLIPDDYALSAMATIVTGYAEIFCELGLGASIIQKEHQASKELSSVFWFGLMVGLVFALACIPFSYITASIFSEDRIIPLTQAVGVLFILSALQIVPMNLLRREMDFKTVGMIEMKCTILSALGMIVIAYYGGGVWALIGGRIIRGGIRVLFVYRSVVWRPSFHFNFSEAKPYLKFGTIVAVSTSLFYLLEKADRFFGGRAWSLEMLGFYLFALMLAQMPTEKIVVLINQVSFPVFSKLQNNMKEFRQFYLNISKITAAIVFPIFVGGYLVGDELVRVLLDDKWIPIITLFEFLCLSQILTALNAANGLVHASRGKPKYMLFYNVIAVVMMSISFYMAVPYGLQAILVPWFTTYVLLCVGFIYFTLTRLGIPLGAYMKAISIPFFATAAMAFSVLLLKSVIYGFVTNYIVLLFLFVLVASIVYLAYIWVFDKKLVSSLKGLRTKGA